MSTTDVGTGSLSIEPPMSLQTVFEEIKSIDYDLKIRNNCDRDVRLLQVVPSCSCTVGILKTDIVPAHSEVTFHVSYDSGTQFGELVKRTIAIKTDHPNQPLLRCEVGGYRRQRYRIEPTSIDFGEHEMGHSDSAEITVDASQEDSALAFDQAHTTSPFVSAQLLQSETTTGGKRHRLRVQILKNAPTGKLNAEVFVPHVKNNQVGPHIMVRAEVKGPLRLVPAAAFLGVMAKRDEPHRVAIRLTMRADMQESAIQSALSELTVEELPAGITATASEGDPSVIVLIADPQKMECGVIEKTAVVCCRYKDQLCRINLEIRSMILE